MSEENVKTKVTLIEYDDAGQPILSVREIKTEKLSVAGEGISARSQTIFAVCEGTLPSSDTVSSPYGNRLFEVFPKVGALNGSLYSLYMKKGDELHGTYRILNKTNTETDGAYPLLSIEKIDDMEYAHRSIPSDGLYLLCTEKLLDNGEQIYVESESVTSGRILYVDYADEQERLHVARMLKIRTERTDSYTYPDAFSKKLDCDLFIQDSDILWKIDLYDAPRAIVPQESTNKNGTSYETLYFCIGHCPEQEIYVGTHISTWNLGDSVIFL